MEDNKWFYLAIAALVITAFMFRWEITAGSGADTASIIHFKIDRYTGTSYTCGRGWCEVDETSD